MSLTLTFTNIAASGAWACNAFFESGKTMSLDGTPLVATSTITNSTIPTGAPTTGSDAGDYEVLVYAWTSNTLITGVASGSTIDITRANAGGSPSVALGHNNTTSLGASTTVTAFSQTLSSANSRKTGVGVLLKSTGGAVLVTVSATQATAIGLAGSAALSRTLTQTQSVAVRRGVMLARTVTQPQSAVLSVFRGLLVTVTATQAQALVLRRAVSLTRRITQAQTVAFAGSIQRLVAIAQATAVGLRKQIQVKRSLTQGQAVSSAFGHGYQRTVAVVQTQAASLVRSIRLTRWVMVAPHVVLGGVTARVLRAVVTTAIGLVKQARLNRALAQPTAAGFGSLPVQLQLVSAVQTRSLDLGRNVFLARLLQQAQALVLKRATSLERTVIQRTLATLERAVSHGVAASVATQATLEWLNVTPRYDILVTARVSQHVSLSSAAAGTTAREFVAVTRSADFAAGSRSHAFAVSRRGARFTVEVR